MPNPQPLDSINGVGEILSNIDSSFIKDASLDALLDSSTLLKQKGFGGGEFYPPCKRAIYILDKIYRCLPVCEKLI